MNYHLQKERKVFERTTKLKLNAIENQARITSKFQGDTISAHRFLIPYFTLFKIENVQEISDALKKGL